MEGKFEQQNPTTPPIFKINEQQEWFIENSYLLMKPTVENLDFATIVTENNPSNLSVKIKKPDFAWNSGVRLILGRYLPHHDHWDIAAGMTYFYGDVSQTVRAKSSQSKGITPTYGTVDNAIQHLKAHWDLNYFSWDLSLGREVAMTKSVVFHPFITLRALLTYQDYQLRNPAMNYKSENSYWGIGPRLGSHLSYYLKSQWSILGELSTAVVYGPYENQITELSRKTKDSVTWLRGNLEGFIGLGWEAWVRNQTVRIFPQVLFEGTLWWDMNRYLEPTSQFSNAHGALVLMGVSFNLQIDF